MVGRLKRWRRRLARWIDPHASPPSAPSQTAAAPRKAEPAGRDQASFYAGPGSNNAAHCADIYLNRIVERGSQPFDDAWMQDTFEAYWQYAGPVTEFTNAMLGEMPSHVQRILGTAAVNKAVALRFSHGYANPEDFQHWLMDPVKADAYLAEVAPEPDPTPA